MPLILFFLTLVYVRGFDGWGAWAAAPILLIPVFVSIALGFVGIILIVHAAQHGRVTPSLVVATLLSGCLGIWFLGRALFFELQRSF